MLELSSEEKAIATALYKITHVDAIVIVIKDLRQQRIFDAEQEVKDYLLK